MTNDRPTEQRFLTFERGGHGFSLAAESVASICDDRTTQPVPLAPSRVAGLTIERGRLLTVLDAEALLGEPSPDSQSCLVVLAPPFGHLALRVAARPQFTQETPDCDILDLEAMVHSLETEIDQRRG